MRARVLLVVVVAALLAVPSAASAKGFKFGVTAGDVSSSSALLWTRPDKPGVVTLQLSSDGHFGNGDDVAKTAKATKGNDNTVTIKVTHLRAGHVYNYRFNEGGKTSDVGRFVTSPKPSSKGPVTFGVAGDADAQREPGKSVPFYNTFQVYGQMAREKNDFNVNLGDTIYSDTTVGGTVEGGAFHTHFPVARTLSQKRAKYRLNLGLPNLRLVRRSTGMYNEWDDHEFIDDFSIPTDGQKLYKAGKQAFLDYMPATFKSKTGLYRTFRWGKNVQVFILDEISFRSAKAGDTGLCDNPDTGEPDIAPTVPQSTRNAYALLYPPLKRPVNPACIARINDPSRHFLGQAQIKKFESAVSHSKARFKVILSEDPWQQTYLFPLDQYEGYAAERAKVLGYLNDNVKNVVVLSADAHWTFFGNVRFRTLENGGPPQDSSVQELVIGAVAVATWGDTINALLQRNDGGELVANVYRAPPPNGPQLNCAALYSYAYIEAKATAKQLTLTPKDLNGKPVHETGSHRDDGPVCGPYKIAAK